MDEAENDVLAFMTFPKAHWSQIYSTNPLERLHAEIKRRTNVVGIRTGSATALWQSNQGGGSLFRVGCRLRSGPTKVSFSSANRRSRYPSLLHSPHCRNVARVSNRYSV
jgi:hypothetical protein